MGGHADCKYCVCTDGGWGPADCRYRVCIDEWGAVQTRYPMSVHRQVGGRAD